MTALDTIIARDLAATAWDTTRPECPARTISYTPAGSAAAEILAVLDSGYSDLRNEGQGDMQRGELSWLIRQSDVALPTAADQITWSGKTYQVREWHEVAVLWRVICVRIESLQKRTPGAREARD